MLKTLEGYKTYLVAVGIGIAAGLHYLGFVNDQLYNTIQTILLGGGLAAIRSALKA